MASPDSQDDWQHVCLISDALPTPHKWKWSVDLSRGGAPLRGLDAHASVSACSAGSLTPLLTGSPCPGTSCPRRDWTSSNCSSAPPSVPLPILWPPLSPGSNSEMPWQSSTPAGKGAVKLSQHTRQTANAGKAFPTAESPVSCRFSSSRLNKIFILFNFVYPPNTSSPLKLCDTIPYCAVFE